MHAQALLIRGAIVLSAAAVAGYWYLDAERYRQQRERAEVAASYVEAAWESIHIGMDDPQVRQLLGPAERTVQVPGWPSRLGEIQGFEQGMRLDLHRMATGYCESKYVLPADREVQWKAWRVAGERRWVAVGFVKDGPEKEWDPVAVAKRSGPAEAAPAGLE